MKFKNKIIKIIGITIISISLLACSSKNSAKKSQENLKENNAKQIVFQVGFENNQTEPTAKAVDKWSELVDKKSNGSIKLEAFPNSSLGSKTDLMDQMKIGQPVITVTDAAYLADYGVKDFGILYAPYLFNNWDEVWKTIDSDWYKELSNELSEKAGLRIISSNWIYGDRSFMTNKKVVLPKDIKGLKVRVSSNDIAIESFKNLGVSPVAMEMGDVYTALQTKVIDGVENPIISLGNRSFDEIRKFLVKDNHILASQIWVCSSEVFDSLTEEQKKVLVDSANEAGLFNNDMYTQATKETEEKMKKSGVEITELTREEFEQWANAGKSFFDLGSKFGWSENLYDKVRNIAESK